MEKRNKLILISLIIITVIILGLCCYFIINNNRSLSDAEKFRDEYMELNDKDNGSGQIYPTVSLNEDNKIKYITEDGTIKLLKEGTGIIYFGYSTCPWCRSLIMPLLEVAEEENVNIYYLDIKDIRSSFSVQNGKLIMEKKGSRGYYEILNLLNDYLDEYYVDYDDELLDTLEKRLYAPTVVAINNGKVTGMHVGTIDTQESGYDRLTNEQVSELKEKLTTLIKSGKNANNL